MFSEKDNVTISLELESKKYFKTGLFKKLEQKNNVIPA